jgi:ribosomal protein S27AE
MSNTTAQSYKKKCSKCANEILMSNHTGKWRATETDGTTFHTCSNSNSNNNSNTGTPESRPKVFADQSINNNVQVKEQQLEQSPALLAAGTHDQFGLFRLYFLLTQSPKMTCLIFIPQ